MSEKLLEEISPACVLCFHYSRLKKPGSRKRSGHLFTAKAKCKMPGCHTYKIFLGPTSMFSDMLSVTVLQAGESGHGEHYAHRWLTGSDRDVLGEEADRHGAYETRGRLLETAPERELRDGNITKAPPASVLRRAACESRAKKRFAKSWSTDIAIRMQVSKDEDCHSSKLPGSIHLLCMVPLTIHMYREHFMKKYAKVHSAIHVDATGTVTKKVGEKRPLFYAVVAENDSGTSFPIGYMLSESHTAPTIGHFLSQLSRDYKVVTGSKFTPPRIVTDFSWAIIHAVTEGILKSSVAAYLEQCWQFVHGKGKQPLTLLSLCCAHASKQLSMELTKLKVPKENRATFMWLFAKMQQARSMAKLDRLFRVVCSLTLSREEPTSLDISLSDVSAVSAEQDEDQSGDVHQEPVKKRKTMRKDTPFGKHFDQVKSMVEEELNEAAGNVTNRFYCPRLTAYLLGTLMPLAPLWSQLITEKTTTNACVESYMRILKKEILRGRRRLNPADFTHVIMTDMTRRMKADLIPQRPVRKGKKPKDSEAMRTATSDHQEIKRATPGEDEKDVKKAAKKRRQRKDEQTLPRSKRVKEGKESQREQAGSGQCPLNETKEAEMKEDQYETDGELEEERWCKKEQELPTVTKPSTYLNRNTPPLLLENLASSRASDLPFATSSQEVQPDFEQHEESKVECAHRSQSVLIGDDATSFQLPPNKHMGFLSHHDLDSLRGCNLVNDNALITFIGAEVAKNNVSVCIFAAQFFDVLGIRGVTTATKRQAAKEKRLQKPVWIIPGNTMGGLHWVLVVVNFRKKIIACFDSLGPGITRTELKMLQKFMAISHPGTAMRWPDWVFLCPEDVPRQRDDSSCGIYVCLFVRSMLTGKPMKADITAEDVSHTREMILSELLVADSYERPYYLTLEEGAPIKMAVPTMSRRRHGENWNILLISLADSKDVSLST